MRKVKQRIINSYKSTSKDIFFTSEKFSQILTEQDPDIKIFIFFHLVIL